MSGYGIAPIFRPGFGQGRQEVGGIVPARSGRPSSRGLPGAWRGRPHPRETVEAVRGFVRFSEMTYGEIAARTGVGRATICRWARAGGWTRPPGAPIATDRLGADLGRAPASERLRARTLASRAQAVAERYLDELERQPEVDPLALAAALEMLRTAKLARKPKPRRGGGPEEPVLGRLPIAKQPKRRPGRPRSPHLPEALARRKRILHEGGHLTPRERRHREMLRRE